MRGQHGVDSLDRGAGVVETALLERRLAAAHEVVGHLREALGRGAVVRFGLHDARVQSPRAVFLGLDEHARLIRELRHV